VSGGEWVRRPRDGGSSTFQVLTGVVTGVAGGDVFYEHQVSPEYSGQPQYIEATMTATFDWVGLFVNATLTGANFDAIGIIFSQTGAVSWGYLTASGMNPDGVTGLTIAPGDRIGLYYDPAIPATVNLYHNGALFGIRTFVGTPATFPTTGYPIFGGNSSTADAFQFDRITITSSPPGAVLLPAPTLTLDAATDQYIGGIRVSATGVLYVSAGPIVGFAPGGIGVDADGVMVVTNEVPELFLAGVGMLHDGTVCGMNATSVSPRAFASGFSNGFS
jgi:hypothetical protein